MNYPRAFAVISAAALAAGLTFAAPPASAGTPVLAHGHIDVTYPTATTFAICPTGAVDDGMLITGEWEFRVEGVRSDGTRIEALMSGSGATFSPPCDYQSTFGAQEGSFTAVLLFAGASSPSASPKTDGVDQKSVPDFTAVAVVETHWTPQQNSIGFGT